MEITLIGLGVAAALAILLMGDLMCNNNYELPQNLFEDEEEL